VNKSGNWSILKYYLSLNFKLMNHLTTLMLNLLCSMFQIKIIKSTKIIIYFNTVQHCNKMSQIKIIIRQIFLLKRARINQIIQKMVTACHLIRDIEIILFNQGVITPAIGVPINLNQLIKKKMMTLNLTNQQEIHKETLLRAL
jgi:hypothetical protein